MARKKITAPGTPLIDKICAVESGIFGHAKRWSQQQPELQIGVYEILSYFANQPPTVWYTSRSKKPYRRPGQYGTTSVQIRLVALFQDGQLIDSAT